MLLTFVVRVSQNGASAVYCASGKGHDEVVRVLLAAKATVNTQSKVSFVVQTLSSQHAVIIVSHYRIAAKFRCTKCSPWRYVTMATIILLGNNNFTRQQNIDVCFNVIRMSSHRIGSW